MNTQTINLPEKEINKEEVSEINGNKKWEIKTRNGKPLKFFPFFKANLQNDVECETVRIETRNDEGETEIWDIFYLDLLMFCYFIGNEEQRMKLSNLQQKTIRYLPYELTFALKPNERDKGVVKRRIELPIDDVLAAYCQYEAMKFTRKQRSQNKI